MPSDTLWSCFGLLRRLTKPLATQKANCCSVLLLKQAYTKAKVGIQIIDDKIGRYDGVIHKLPDTY